MVWTGCPFGRVAVFTLILGLRSKTAPSDYLSWIDFPTSGLQETSTEEATLASTGCLERGINSVWGTDLLLPVYESKGKETQQLQQLWTEPGYNAVKEKVHS